MDSLRAGLVLAWGVALAAGCGELKPDEVVGGDGGGALEAGNAAGSDAEPPDAEAGTGPEGSIPEGGADAGDEAGSTDAGSEGGTDAGNAGSAMDAGSDRGADAGDEAGATDGSVDLSEGLDSDSDGVADRFEGQLDADADGLPAYLDVDETAVNHPAGDAPGGMTCAAALTLGSGSTLVEVDTSAADDDYASSCGGVGSTDLVVEWVAPTADYWVLDTQGSGFDTVLSVYDDCNGAELACNQNAPGGGSHSELVVRAGRDQRLAVVIDGNAGSQGEARLNANPVVCPSQDVPLAALPTTFTDSDGDDDVALRFVPERDGFYAIHVSGTGDGSLCLHRGPRCTDPEVVCSEGLGSFYGAEVRRELKAGEPYTLRVSPGAGGSFELSIDPVDGGQCATEALPINEASPALTGISPSLLTGSCNPSGFHAALSSTRVPSPELLFLETLPASVTAPTMWILECSSDQPIAMYLVERDCGGRQLQCNVSDGTDSDGNYWASVSLEGNGTDQTFVVAVEKANNFPAQFTFTCRARVLQ